MTAPCHALPSRRGVATGRNLGSLASRMWDVHTVAAQLVPRSGPVIIASNHSGFLDGPLLASVSPRPLHLLVRSRLSTGALARVLTAFGQVPLDPEEPDRSALRCGVELLADDRAVGVFPEARPGRGDAARARHGVAYLALASEAPVVPVAVLGTRRSGAPYDSLPPLRARLDVVFGSPLRLERGSDHRRRAVVASVGELIRQQLCDHVQLACTRTGQRLPEPPRSMPDTGGSAQ